MRTKLLIDGQAEISLKEFIKVNTEKGVCSIDPEDIATIKNMNVGETHYIACDKTFCTVKKIIDLDSLNPFQRWEMERYGSTLTSNGKIVDVEDDRMSTAEESYVFSLENPE